MEIVTDVPSACKSTTIKRSILALSRIDSSDMLILDVFGDPLHPHQGRKNTAMKALKEIDIHQTWSNFLEMSLGQRFLRSAAG